jgi:hypothetical protein
MDVIRRRTVALVVGAVTVVSSTGCVSSRVVETANRRLTQGLSASELTTARVVAMRWVDREDARASAAVTVSRGRVRASVADHHRACTSGRLLHITLRGDFPHLHVPGSSAAVHGAALTADAASGTICGVTPLTGVILPDPGAVTLFSG